MWLRRCAVLLACLCAFPAGAALRVLARPGDVASDGVTLGGFTDLAAVGDGVVARVTTEALVRVTDQAPAVLVRTGDPLPPPLTGRFASLGGADIGATGSVVFVARFPAAEIGRGLFEVDDAGVRLLSLDLVGTPREVATNAAGDVLGSNGRLLMLWRRSDGAVTRLLPSRLPDGTRVRRIYPGISLTDDGTAVFTARIRPSRGGSRDEEVRVLRRTPDGALATLTATRATPSGRAAAANPLGDVVQVLGIGSAQGVFLHPAGGAEPLRMAGPGDAVGALAIQRMRDGLVGVDDRRRATFFATLDDGLHVLLADGGVLRSLAGPIAETTVIGGGRLPDSTVVPWQAGSALFRTPDTSAPILGPSVGEPLGLGFTVSRRPLAVNRAGAVLAVMARDGLYELTRTGAHPVLRESDAVDGGRVITLLDHSASPAGDLVALATLDDGRTALLSRSDAGGWARLVSDGDPNDRGDAIGIAEMPAYDARRGTMVAGLALKDTDRTVLHALRPHLPPALLFVITPERTLFEVTDAPVLLRDALAFWGRRPGEEGGSIYVRRGSTVRTVASPGTRVRGESLAWITDLRATGGGLIFDGALGDERSGLFAWRPGRRLRRVDRARWPSLWRFVAGQRAHAAIGWRNESAPPALYLLTPRGARRLAVAGDPSPLGGTLSFGEIIGDEATGRPIALTRRGVAFLEGSAVLEAHLPRRPAPR